MSLAMLAIATPPPLPQQCASVDNTAPHIRVSLAHVEQRINVYLRFGHPDNTVRIDLWRRIAMFPPAAIFCRIHWESNDFGTTRWQLMVMRASTARDGMQRVPGVRPGASILLRAESERPVRAVLSRIDAIEALGIDPVDVSPAYWRTLGNRLAAHQPLPAYGLERHAAWLSGKDMR